MADACTGRLRRAQIGRKEMPTYRNKHLTHGLWRRAAGVLLAASCVVYTGCASAPAPPLYAQADRKTMCEQQGGWWRPDVSTSGGYCEYQAPAPGGAKHCSALCPRRSVPRLGACLAISERSGPEVPSPP